jgi:TonB-dependent receptor
MQYATRRTLAAAIVAASTAAVPTAHAQDDATQTIEEMTVYGIRGSLGRALEQKRMADDVRDVITNLEVGQFPDQNLAEAVQRLPGVAISRNQGEGRFVTIRGLPPELNRIAVNGVALPSTEDGRAVPLDVFSADLFGSLAVVKSQAADADEGALGGSMELDTPAPLSLADGRVAGTVRSFYNELSEDWGPAASVVASKHFADGRFGAVAGLTFSDRSIRQDTWSSGGWNPVGSFFDTGDAATNDLLVWENGKPRLFLEERERTAALVGLEADDETWGHWRLDVLWSAFDVERERYQFLHKFKKSADITDIVGDGEKVVAARFVDSTLGVNQQYMAEESDARIVTLRGDRRIGQWSVESLFGYSRIENEVPDDYKFVWESSGFGLGYDVSEPFDPVFSYQGITQTAALSDPSLYPKLKQVVAEPREATDERLDLDLSAYREFVDAGVLERLGVGLDLRGRDKERVQTQYKDKSVRPPLSDFIVGGGTATPGASDFLDGDFPFWSGVAADFDALRAGLVPAGGFSFAPDLLGSFDVGEEVAAGWVRADLGAGPVSGNLGIRAVRTATEADGYEVVDAGPTPVTFDNTYTEWLPSGTLRVDLRDDLVLRASLARAMVRPAFEDMAPRRSVNEIDLKVSQGNPGLEPFLANQVDLTAEWYFGDDAMVAVAFFHKDVESFIFDQTRSLVVDDPARFGADPALAGSTFEVTRPENGDGAEVTGVELVWQQPLDFLPAALRGFGVSANYTWTDSEAQFSANESGADQGAGEGLGGQDFGLPGLSSSVLNTTLYYDRAGFTARLSWNQRTRYLDSPAGAEGQPEYVEDFGQLDAYVGYAVNEHVTVFAEGINLNDEPLRRYSDPGRKLEEYSVNGYRVFAGVRVEL